MTREKKTSQQQAAVAPAVPAGTGTGTGAACGYSNKLDELVLACFLM